MQFIDLKKQYSKIKDDVLKEINEVLDSGHYIMGEKVQELETELSKFVGVKHSIGVADGTKALLIALMALGIKSGDEVIVPAFTFISTASMVVLLGAKPVFVDIDPQTYNMDPKILDGAITAKTKVIIPVSLFGQCANLPAINEIAAKHNITVIEDAGQGFGAKLEGKRSCSFTTIACTSFFPSKPLGCYGDGGACFTNDDELAHKMRMLRIHGQDKRYHHEILGVNGRLDTLQAAVLLAKMRVLDEELKLRGQIGARYTELLSDSSCVTPYVVPNSQHTYAQYSILVNDRDSFVAKLKAEGVPTAIHYPIPLHLQPSLSQFGENVSAPHSENIANQVVSLPMHPYLQDKSTQDQIVNVVKKAVS